MIDEHAGDIPDPVKTARPRILVGMMRPPAPPDTRYVDSAGQVKFADILLCACGAHLWTREGVREHWQMGHMDTPVYKDVD